MTKKNPLVSVVIPCYNHAEFVQESIQSVIDQDYDNIELIIIDDGSKDNSVEVIQGIVPACRERFERFEFRQRPNKGLSATLNEAIDWCNGKYFSACASDDILYAEATTVSVKFLEKNREYGMCHAHAESIYDKPNINKTIVKDKELKFIDLMLKNQIYAPTVMMRMALFDEIGRFDESLFMEDWDMWLRITHSGHKIGFINETLAFYRQHDNNSYNNHEKMEEASDQILTKWRSHPAYKDACKQENLKRFYSYAPADKLRALRYLPLALMNITDKRVLYGFVKLILPLSVISGIRSMHRMVSQ